PHFYTLSLHDALPILIALALGYWVGGALADRFQRISFLAYLLAPAGVVTVFIPDFAEPLMNVIIQRHPTDRAIPLLWQKLDPALDRKSTRLNSSHLVI